MECWGWFEGEGSHMRTPQNYRNCAAEWLESRTFQSFAEFAVLVEIGGNQTLAEIRTKDRITVSKRLLDL